MKLKELQGAMIAAMKAKDKFRKDAISALVSAVKKKGIDNGCRDNIPDEMANEAILKEIKSVKEQIDTCPADRTELLEEYKKRYEIMSEFAPKMLSAEEVKAILEEKFADVLATKNKGQIMIATLEEYSFRSSDPVHGGRVLLGQLVDKHTFLGLIRIDYKSIQTGDQGYYEEIPEEMSLQLEIPYFFLYPKGASKETVRGNWKFPELSVSQSDKEMQVIEIGETNAAGFGLDRIEVSPVELTVYDIFPENHLVVTVVLDKDGRKLTYAGNNTNELAVSGYDISEITVYLYDYDEYMEIKGLALEENSTAFREILEKNALYEKKISIETDKS